MGLWMIVASLFWLAALGLLIWALVRWLGSRSQTPPPGPSAREILRQRYARGEIDTATFEQTRERLEKGRTGSREPNDVRELSTPRS